MENIYENKQKIISKKAIILVFPDGYVESIDESLIKEKDSIYHINYYKLLFGRSKRLKRFLFEYDKYFGKEGIGDHNIIDKELVALNGVAVFLNQSIGQPQKDRTNGLSFFMVFLPNEYGSIEQMVRIEKLLKWYPENRLALGDYEEELQWFKTIYLDDVLKNIEENKKIMEEEINYGKF
ncbi:MAG: hypothetical protein ACI31M_02190 [Bacilli bacterium]